MTASTTIGLGVVYNGVRTRPGQEFVLSTDDHPSHVLAAQLAAEKRGAKVRLCSWFRDSAQATADEIIRTVREQIRPETRVLGVTWVQSGTGVRMPVRRIAEVVREANQGRAEADRCLLVVDGVHGLAAVDQDGARLGADILVSRHTQVALRAARNRPGVGLSPGARPAPADVRHLHLQWWGGAALPGRIPGLRARLRAAGRRRLPSAARSRPRRGPHHAPVHPRQTRTGRYPRSDRAHPADPEMSAGITCFSVRATAPGRSSPAPRRNESACPPCPSSRTTARPGRVSGPPS